MKYPILYKLVCVFAFILLAGSVSGKKPIKTLIVTGQNNHNWQVSNVALKKIMEQSGRFVVDVAVSPAAGEDMSSFSPDFAAYQLVVWTITETHGLKRPSKTLYLLPVTEGE